MVQTAVFTDEERKDGVAFRNILLAVFKPWKAAKFEEIINTGLAYNPAVIWDEMSKNPITGIATRLATSRVREDPARYFRAITLPEMTRQIVSFRPDLSLLATSVKGQEWIAFFINGFKQVLCRVTINHAGHIQRDGEKVWCSLCGFAQPLKKGGK